MSKFTQLYLFYCLIPLGLLISCQASYGEKYTKGNLEIFYTEDCSKYVEPVANYFEGHGLIQKNPHSIQLTSTSMGSENPGFIMKMIITDKKKAIPENQMHQISTLERDLKSQIYNDLNFRIEICNENFVPIDS